MVRQLEEMKRERQSPSNNSSRSPNRRQLMSGAGSNNLVGRQGASGGADDLHDVPGTTYECVALHISPDLGERIMLSGERAVIDESFPETAQALLDARSSVAWNHDARHVIRFPLNGYCKINSMQAITRLLNAGFKLAGSNGGGVEGQQFSEYLFLRKVYPM